MKDQEINIQHYNPLIYVNFQYNIFTETLAFCPSIVHSKQMGLQLKIKSL